MDLGQIIDTALRLYRQNFGELLAIAAITLPLDIINAVGIGLISDKLVAGIVSAVLAIPSALIGLVAIAGITRAVADLGDGVAPDFNRVYRQVLPRLGALLLTALRVIVIVLALTVTIVGIPYAIYLGIRWTFFAQEVVIELLHVQGFKLLEGTSGL